MARIFSPTVDNVEVVTTYVEETYRRICLVIRCRGREPMAGETEACVELLFPITHDDYARALAAAINAVPVPKTEEA